MGFGLGFQVPGLAFSAKEQGDIGGKQDSIGAIRS